MDWAEEIAKCHNDFCYFAENYIKILHHKQGLIPFHLYDYHKRLVKAYNDNRFVIVKKFRQAGFTTLTALYGLWRCAFHLDQRFMFISKTEREVWYISRIVERAMDYLPLELQPVMLRNNDHTRDFADSGSCMNFSMFQAGCGRSSTHLVIDEPAFIPDMWEQWKALYPTISTGGKCFAVGTPNGMGNWFEKVYHGAEQGQNNFEVFECCYKEHPEFQDEARAEQIKKALGPAGWAQEVEGKFL
jgi:phage FluMu gp28-like protein